MKRKLSCILLAAMLCALCVAPAHALEYTIAAPADYLFARATSDETIYEWEDPNVDSSKDVALIPPAFGTTSSSTLVGQTGITVITGEYPPVDAGASVTIGYTEVTDALYYANGSLGTLHIPAIGLTVGIYEGTGSAPLLKGTGHFTNTSIWNGNVCIAGHNRGVTNHFGRIHTLSAGDTIILTTALGTRTYAVVSVEKVLETDVSGLAPTITNMLSLYTCVEDQPAYRWRVTAVEQAG